jgi:hypothetical protein
METKDERDAQTFMKYVNPFLVLDGVLIPIVGRIPQTDSPLVFHYKTASKRYLRGLNDAGWNYIETLNK